MAAVRYLGVFKVLNFNEWRTNIDDHYSLFRAPKSWKSATV